jgi:phage head maturation protease
MSDLLRFEGIEPILEVRSESEREIGIRFMKYGEIGRTDKGLEMFVSGAFRESDPTQVILRSEHEGPPAGRGVSIEEKDDSAVLVARAAPTARGDELMTLAKEGYFRGASPTFAPREGGTSTKYVGRDRVTVRSSVDLREVSLTWRPTYAGTEVLYARTQTLEDSPVADTPAQDAAQEAQAPQPRGVEVPTDPHALSDLRQRLQALEARSATETEAEVPEPDKGIPFRGEWVQAALTLMDGGALTSMQQRTLADIVSDDNAGFMPVAYTNELIGIIDPIRPFMNSTRRIEMPSNGLELSFPRIVTRPEVGEQTTEKAEVTSTTVETDRITRSVRTFAGAGDLSLQLLRRSSPQFLDFYLQLLAEAYAQVTDNAAVEVLLAAGVEEGTGAFDPEAPAYGEAIGNGLAAGRSLVPDRIWLSTAALTAFIDAKSPTGGGGTPLYPGLASVTGVSGGAGGGPLPVQMTPVWTPALDDADVDIIIGPSRGFAWAEEGTFTLQADVPGKLGRDVALAGFVVFVDAYPAAFTTYEL